MGASSQQEVTRLLRAWRGGDQAALEKLTPLVYQELHRLARRYMARERRGHTLQTTALVNEAYIRLIDVKKVDWRNRAQFFAISAKLMRQILVDFARWHRYPKHGGGIKFLSLKEAQFVASAPDLNLLKLDDALDALDKSYSREASVVELRFFVGLSLDETAEVLQISRETVKSDWRFAKAWLLRQMSDGENDNAGTRAGS